MAYIIGWLLDAFRFLSWPRPDVTRTVFSCKGWYKRDGKIIYIDKREIN